MFEYALPDAPLVINPTEEILAQGAEAPAPPEPGWRATPEQTRAVEAIFTADNQESEAVAGLLGMWTGTLLLHDLAKEAFSKPADEEVERVESKKKTKEKE